MNQDVFGFEQKLFPFRVQLKLHCKFPLLGFNTQPLEI